MACHKKETINHPLTKSKISVINQQVKFSETADVTQMPAVQVFILSNVIMSSDSTNTFSVFLD